MDEAHNPLAAFIVAACLPLDGGHASGTIEHAQAILSAHPEVAASGIYAAAVLADDAGVRWSRAPRGVDPSVARARRRSQRQ